MTELRTALVHKCGQVIGDEDHCPGCGRPIMRIPAAIRDLARTTEEYVGLDRLRISLLGIVTAAYMQGWDDAVSALDKAYRP